MPNTLFPTWVKNVYSLLKLSGLNSGPTYTQLISSPTFTQPSVNKLLSLPLVLPTFQTQFSTQKINKLPLLIDTFYPQSTPPTIKRTKER